MHAYSSSTYRRIFSYQMDQDTDTPSPIRSLYYIKSSGRVVVALHSGRIFLCQSDTIPVKDTGGEGTFILTELGTSGCVHSVTSINKVSNLTTYFIHIQEFFKGRGHWLYFYS